MAVFSIQISTKNRLHELKDTLLSISNLINDKEVECIVFDDGSTDGTFDFIKGNYPEIKLYKNEISKGYIYCRNFMLNNTDALYVISLDDDANFVSTNVLQIIKEYFQQNITVGVIAARIFWGKKLPQNCTNIEKLVRVQSYVGCGHIWNVKAWKSIPNYPEWFVFYGEEEFASYQLFKKNWEIHYVPEIFVQHRVEVKERKKNKDYQLRLRRSLRSGWYLYFIFFPFVLIPKRILYSMVMQFKLKVIKGDIRAFFAILQALFDVIINFNLIIKSRNGFTLTEFEQYNKIEKARIFWKPENETL